MNFRFIYRFHLEKEGHVLWTWFENDKGIRIRVTTLELAQQDAMATAYAVLEAVVISIGIKRMRAADQSVVKPHLDCST